MGASIIMFGPHRESSPDKTKLYFIVSSSQDSPLIVEISSTRLKKHLKISEKYFFIVNPFFIPETVTDSVEHNYEYQNGGHEQISLKMTRI